MEDAGVLSLELVHGLGARAAPALEVLLAALEKETRRKTDVRHTLEAAALIPREDAAAILASRLGSTDAKAIAGRYFRAAPALAMRALPPIAGGRAKVAEVARALLAAVLAEHPELAASALPELGPPPAAPSRPCAKGPRCTATRPPRRRCPAVLARPPWRHLAERDVAVVRVAIADVAFPVDPEVHQRDVWATKLHWVPNALVFSPRVAPAVAHAWLHRPDDRGVGEGWLRAFPEMAAVGLVPASLRDPSATRLDAERAIRFLAAVAPEAVDRAVGRYGEAVRAGVATLRAIDPLHDCPFEPPKLPELARVDALPRPLLRRLGPGPPARGGEAPARDADLRGAAAGRALRRRRAGPGGLRSGLARRLRLDALRGLPRGGGPGAGRVGAGGAGPDRGRRRRRRLAAKIRAWPAEHAVARAPAGIDVLARIGTDVALMHLSSFAERTRFPNLKTRARGAAGRGGAGPRARPRRARRSHRARSGPRRRREQGPLLRRAIVPGGLRRAPRSGGLGRGRRCVLRSLPRPSKADDADKARAAQETWKALKHDAEAIAGGQIQRLEQAMISGRRWDPTTFRHLLVEHLLLVHLVRRLLFAAYDAGGGLLQLFRVAEDRTFADAGDAPLGLAGAAAVGLPHPLDLPREALSAWGTFFADYELLQPFPQLGREVFTLTDAERAVSELRRFADADVETARLFALEHRGWRRSSREGGESSYTLRLPGRQVALFGVSPGINFANPRETPVQTLGAIQLWGLVRSAPGARRALPDRVQRAGARHRAAGGVS